MKKSKRCRDGGIKLLANKVHIQGMEVSLADKVHKQEPQRMQQLHPLSLQRFDFSKNLKKIIVLHKACKDCMLINDVFKLLGYFNIINNFIQLQPSL